MHDVDVSDKAGDNKAADVGADKKEEVRGASKSNDSAVMDHLFL